MKRLLFIAIFLSAHMSFAQLYMGAVTGLSTSKVYFSPAFNQTISTGFSGGLMLTYLENEALGIDLGLLYNQRGWNLDYTDTAYSRLNNMIELPFLSHFTLGKGTIRGVLQVGANLGYVMSANEESTSNSGAYTFTKEDNRITFGLSGGLGMKYVKPDWYAIFAIRYVNDLSNLYESSELTYCLSQFFLIQGGISFRLKREG
jgi:hypothetical protein